MIRINENYLKLQASYLFSEIRKRTNAFQEAHPEREIIRLGIGDVTGLNLLSLGLSVGGALVLLAGYRALKR